MEHIGSSKKQKGLLTICDGPVGRLGSFGNKFVKKCKKF